MQYLKSAIRQFEYYKQLGEKSMAQLSDDQLFVLPSNESNSIAIIVQHLWGNMLSRWTDFKTTDGEKASRDRDGEFEPTEMSREALMQKWNEGWDCLFTALNSITDDELEEIIYIRNEGHTILEAINRQIAHYCYHVGQIVLLAKILIKGEFQTLSIARNASKQFNQGKFEQEKTQKHFTDDLLDKN